MKGNTGRNWWGLLNIACDIGIYAWTHVHVHACHGKNYKRYIATLETLLAKQGEAANPFVFADVRCVLLEPWGRAGQDQRRWRPEYSLLRILCLAASLHVLPKNTDPVAVPLAQLSAIAVSITASLYTCTCSAFNDVLNIVGLIDSVRYTILYCCYTLSLLLNPPIEPLLVE